MAGYSYPQAPLAWMNVDAIALIDRGYALVTVAAGGTVYARKNPDGTDTIDTNPRAGAASSGPRRLMAGRRHLGDRSRPPRPHLRPGAVDAAFHETALRSDTVVQIYVPDWNEETGQFGLIVEDPWITNPWAVFPAAAFWAPSSCATPRSSSRIS
jgi:hypothetical protein